LGDLIGDLIEDLEDLIEDLEDLIGDLGDLIGDLGDLIGDLLVVVLIFVDPIWLGNNNI
jgi:hypothetical protein